MARRTLALLLVLLVATRAALVLALADVFFYGEELAKGAAAKAMLDGLPVEHWKLGYVPHEGGGFVVSHLEALAFLAVGESVLALKLVAILFSALILAAGYRFVLGCFGARAAAIFGVLFVLAPSAFLRFSLLALGTHFEALLFLTLVLHFTARIERATPPRRRDFVLLGLAAGFGLYFSLQILPAIAASAAWLLSRARGRLNARSIALVAGGFLLGAAPLAAMVERAGLDALLVRGQGPRPGSGALAALEGLFEPLSSQGDVFDWIAVVVVPLVVVVAFAARPTIGHADWKRRASLVVLLLAAFFGAYVASGLALPNTGHWIFFIRLSTPWFFATVLFAAAAANLLARPERGARALAIVATTLLVVAGLDDFASLARTGDLGRAGANARRLASLRGYDWVLYFDKLEGRLDGAEREKIAVLRALDDDPDLLDPAIAHSVFARSTLALDEVLAVSRGAFGERWLPALRGLGPRLAPGGRYDVEAAFAGIAAAPAETRAVLAEAIGRTGYGLKVTPEKLEREIAADVEPASRPAYLRGVGWRMYLFDRLHPEPLRARIDRASEPQRSALREGFDAAERAHSLASPAD